MAGTVLGALLAWILLVQESSVWTVVAVLVLLQIATEMVIGVNYAFGANSGDADGAFDDPSGRAA